jgi:hypothetical protein
MAGAAWETYDRWNEAVAAVMFPELGAPEPVYLDMEDDQLEALASAMGTPADAVESELGRAVAATLDLDDTRVFRAHSSRLWRWSRGDRRCPPPVLALLAVLSLAAEHMSRGDGLGEGNFYGRLREALHLPTGDDRLPHAYRMVAERYWGTLNAWLTDFDGRRGLPTAYALGHRYVGLPISQALVRRGDRERLVTFFQQFGFSPGVEVPPAELEQVLDVWMHQVPCPATRNLERLWAKADARSRIAQTASVALAGWDGRVRESDEAGGARGGRISLALEIGGFPTKRFRLGVLVFAPQPDVAREVAVVSDGEPTSVSLAPAIPGALALGQSAEIDAENLLEGVLRLRDPLSAAELVRRPRRLVVFRQDQLSMRWLETEQVLLGDDVTLVAHEALEGDLTRILEAIARPGWEVVRAGYRGLPERWIVVRGVEVLSHPGDLVPQRMNDLGALVPLTSSQLKIAGGFQLPGATRGKWHSWAPPEIRAVSDVPGGFEVKVVRLGELEVEDDDAHGGENELVASWTDDGQGVLLAGLEGCGLGDGDYRVEMVPRGKREALTTTHLRLRSGDTPDARQWQAASEIEHALGDPLSLLGAGRESAGGGFVRGPVAGGPAGRLFVGEIASSPTWDTSRESTYVPAAAGARVTLPDPASCLYTGEHREQLEYVPVDERGRPLQRFSVGTCSGCGLVRRYSTSYWRNVRARERAARQPAAPRRHVADLTPVQSDDSRSWDLVLDGIMHTGGGRWSLLERLAMHIEPTALFVDQLARALESLGHIDVRRDPESLQPLEWEVTPTVLASTGRGHLMAGYWPDLLTQHVVDGVTDRGVAQVSVAQVDGPTSWYLGGDEVVGAVADVDGGVGFAGGWSALAERLPVLSEVVEALPRRSAGVDGRARWFDVRSARWADAVDLRRPGAYRITRFTTHDVVRTHGDVDAGTMATSTVHLSKHVAALVSGARPLISYDAVTEELVVPLGADLPGLYGRTAVLASGLLPVASGALLVYREVPRELAQHLAHLLSH